jgi:toxoflavin synthase
MLTFEVTEPFDLVVMPFVLSLANTPEMLLNMCRAAFRNLKTGGVFLVLDDNVFLSPENYALTEKYGFRKETEGALVEGAKIVYTIPVDEDDVIVVQETYFSKQTWENCVKNAGFRDVTWHTPQISPEGLEKLGAAYWKDMVDMPITHYLKGCK